MSRPPLSGEHVCSVRTGNGRPYISRRPRRIRLLSLSLRDDEHNREEAVRSRRILFGRWITRPVCPFLSPSRLLAGPPALSENRKSWSIRFPKRRGSAGFSVSLLICAKSAWVGVQSHCAGRGRLQPGPGTFSLSWDPSRRVGDPRSASSRNTARPEPAKSFSEAGKREELLHLSNANPDAPRTPSFLVRLLVLGMGQGLCSAQRGSGMCDRVVTWARPVLSEDGGQRAFCKQTYTRQAPQNPSFRLLGVRPRTRAPGGWASGRHRPWNASSVSVCFTADNRRANPARPLHTPCSARWARFRAWVGVAGAAPAVRPNYGRCAGHAHGPRTHHTWPNGNATPGTRSVHLLRPTQSPPKAAENS